MSKRWKVAAVVVALTLATGVAYGVVSLAGEPVQSAIVLNVGWGNGPDQVGVIRWEDEPWQGPGTFTTGGGKFFLADEVNHRIQVYEGGQWVKSIPLPLEVQHVKELRLCSDSLFLYGFFDGAPADGGLRMVDLKTGRFSATDLGSIVPGFTPPYGLRVLPEGLTVRRTGPDLDPQKAYIVAVLDATGRVVRAYSERAAFGGDFIWCGREPTELAEQLKIYKRTNRGVDGAPIDVPGTPGAMGIYINWDDSRVVVLTKPRELFGQKGYYINVYDSVKGSWQPHLVSVAVENEIPPSFSTGDMLQYANAVLYEMAYTTDGVVIYQYVLP